MIVEVNEMIFKTNDLEMSIVNPFFGYVLADDLLKFLRKFNFGIEPCFMNKTKRDFSNDGYTDILSELLVKLFPSLDGIISIKNNGSSCIKEKYFSKDESRSKNIEMFSSFFVYLLEKDKIFTTNLIEILDEQIFSLLYDDFKNILDIDITDKEELLAFTLLSLHAFMLEVLDTNVELLEYVTNIIDNISEDDIKIIKTSDIYFLSFSKEESQMDEKSLINKLYNMPDKKFPYNFDHVPCKDELNFFYNNKSDNISMLNKSLEIALLHLCNFLFYDEEKEQYDLEHLKLDKNSDLLKFYKKYNKSFDINHVVKFEWFKMLQCLDDIKVSKEVYNRNLGKIIYVDNELKIEHDVFIYNIATILTKLCMSQRNDIEKEYIELFCKNNKTHNIICQFRNFLSLIANRKITVECMRKHLEIIDGKIYGTLKIVTSLKKCYKIKAEMLFCFKPKNINVTFLCTELFLPNELEKISFEYTNNQELKFVKYLIVKYVEDLKYKFIKNYEPIRTYQLFNKTLVLKNCSMEEYLHYLFDTLNDSTRDSNTFKIVEMVVKYILEEVGNRCKDLLPFYIRINDLKNEISSDEYFEIWFSLLKNFDYFVSKKLMKLWTDEIWKDKY